MNTAFSQKQIESINYLDKLLLTAEARYQGDYSSMTVDSFETHGKCGLWLSFEVARNWNQFSDIQKNRLHLLLSPKEFHKDTIIGHFHIFYDTTDYNEPALLDDYGQRIPNSSAAFVDSVGKYFNQSWEYFIDSLGYLPSPMQEGKIYYTINIENLGSYLYGETIFLDSDRIGDYFPPRYSSYIRVDNDFKDVYSKGINGVKVTAAHEFHHAIQLGSYGFLRSDLYFYEITSTWMEDVLFDAVNDYYQYLKYLSGQPKGQFLYPDISFTSNLDKVTYSRAIWGKFIEKRYSRNVMRRTWETIRSQYNSVHALDNALAEVGSSFRQAFREWTTWNFHTGPTCDTINYYTEGKHYPLIETRSPIEYENSPKSFSNNIEAISSVYHPICLLNSPSDNCNSSAHMIAMISNLNIDAAFSASRFGFIFNMTNSGDASYKKLANGIFVKLIVPDPENWIIQDTVPTVISEVVVYPNPFRPHGLKRLYFALRPARETTALLNIYSSSMDRITIKEVDVQSKSFEPKIFWDGRDSRGNLVPSGIYFYVISVDGKMYNGKFAVIRE